MWCGALSLIFIFYWSVIDLQAVLVSGGLRGKCLVFICFFFKPHFWPILGCQEVGAGLGPGGFRPPKGYLNSSERMGSGPAPARTGLRLSVAPFPLLQIVTCKVAQMLWSVVLCGRRPGSAQPQQTQLLPLPRREPETLTWRLPSCSGCGVICPNACQSPSRLDNVFPQGISSQRG